MVRTVYSPEYCLQYLEQYASQEAFVIGLIIGQACITKLYYTHLSIINQCIITYALHGA